VNAYSGVSPAATTALSRDRARGVFGQVMGLVALTLGCLALGACIGRDLSGGIGILCFVAGFACIFGLNVPRHAETSSSQSRFCSASGCCWGWR
jgi:hypothetical protein